MKREGTRRMGGKMKQWTAALACAGTLTALAGCMPGPKYRAPSAPIAKAPAYQESTVHFINAPGWKVASPSAAMLRGDWWRIFNEPELNALEAQVKVNNQNIKIAFNDYMAARAEVREARAQYWPTVSTSPEYNRSRSSGNLGSSSSAFNEGRESQIYSLPLSVSWEPDLFGRIRREVDEAEYGAQVSAADLAGETLAEQASLAEYYFELRGQDALQQLLNNIVATDKQSLALTQELYKTGVDDYISVVEAKSALASAQSAALNAGVSRAQYEHAIAMLTGKPATDFSLPPMPLLATPPPIPVGVPSELLERRPDIAAAERTLAEANATIGIGYGAFFPNLVLSAEGGFESSLFKHWFDWPSRFWAIGPSISQTIFNGGLYRAQLHQFSATYNADVASYRQTVLTAFEQVEDNLAAVRILSQQVIKQQQAVDSAKTFLKLETGRYQTGLDPYIDVMTAQTTVLNDEETLAALHIQEMTASIELIQALGGGWSRSQLPTVKQVAATPAKGTYSLQH